MSLHHGTCQFMNDGHSDQRRWPIVVRWFRGKYSCHRSCDVTRKYMQGVKWMRLEGPTPICFVVCLKRERCTSLTFQNSISYSSNIWGCKKSCFKCSSSSCLTSGVQPGEQKLVVIELCRWVSTRVVCLSVGHYHFFNFQVFKIFQVRQVCCLLSIVTSSLSEREGSVTALLKLMQ